jgi:hypothetical protein
MEAYKAAEEFVFGRLFFSIRSSFVMDPTLFPGPLEWDTIRLWRKVQSAERRAQGKDEVGGGKHLLLDGARNARNHREPTPSKLVSLIS